MHSMTQALDLFVKGVKESGDFSDAKFVFAGKERSAEFPLSGFIVACGVGNVKFSCESSYETVTSVQLIFDVYAKSGASKRELTQFCEKLFNCLATLHSPYITESIKVSDAKFEDNLCVWLQRVSVDLLHKNISEDSEDTEGEGSDSEDNTQNSQTCFYRLFAENGAIAGVVGFEESVGTCEYAVKELLSGTVDYINESCSDKQLIITTRGDECTAFCAESFTILEQISGTQYKGCRIHKLNRKAQDTGFVNKYTLTYENKTCTKEAT